MSDDFWTCSVCQKIFCFDDSYVYFTYSRNLPCGTYYDADFCSEDCISIFEHQFNVKVER